MRSIHVNCKNSLEFHAAENYADLINNMLTVYHRMRCYMSLKMHFLYSHAVRDNERYNWFRTDALIRFIAIMIVDYLWFLPQILHRFSELPGLFGKYSWVVPSCFSTAGFHPTLERPVCSAFLAIANEEKKRIRFQDISAKVNAVG